MKRSMTFFGIIVLLKVVASVASAQAGGGYDLTWSTIDNGGGTSTGGGYSLMGSIGQADTGSVNGGAYTLQGGFWNGASIVITNYQVFLPIIVR